MTSTTKNPPETDGQGNSGTSLRTNAVCLEVNVTLRSLPTETNAQAQPIREDLKTVIVFDNGAVLRSTNNLPGGMTLILSNPSGRDVVCRVVTGRSMPAVKGYVEVEFMEPVKDFWDIHRESVPAPAALVAAPAPKTQAPSPAESVRQEAPATPSSFSSPRPLPPPVVVPPARPAPPVEPWPNPASAASGTMEYDEFPAPMGSMGVPSATLKAEPRPQPEQTNRAPAISAKAPVLAEKSATEYSHTDQAAPTSVASWMPPVPAPPAPAPPAPAQVFQATQESFQRDSSSPAATRDFMSQGLMAYEKPGNAASGSGGQTPLLLGAAALVLATVCGVVFFLHRGSGAAPALKAASTAPPAAQPPTGGNAPPPLMQTTQQSRSPVDQNETQPPTQNVSAQPVQPAVAVAPIPPADITLNSVSGSSADSRSARRPDKAAAAPKQAAQAVQAAVPKRPMISDLKMVAPSAPTRNVDPGGEAAEIAPTDLSAGAPNASLLSASGRTTTAPAAPAAPPPPPKVMTDPKLVSSVRPIYPQSARQANIEGSVNVVVYIDQAGKVSDAKALSGPVMLRAPAEESVKLWKYSPGLEDGKPVQSHTVVRVDFKISN